ncbi:GTPase RIA1 [Ascoidea rubescens DSM 1968]|uniref:Ribosome assembly protein 1 n=1 Tax=Ascoidea rubescens DSM 1968 TaxID=1344418 RepID=A0A1D2VE30_9ASCO|nr:P-loop containing nucleoside triphosphate hydrolase protein [Ascoidea rubescens DSM 1968]ODV59753.1 P-loop containing nucleoside triphosphate hydrolase protein [Ascoidea rubescens DSM 1968]
MKVGIDTITRLQNDPFCIRNICILAHVDHGKTTLSDSLLASNGIISQRMAGKVRYLDSRPDEQSRGITMESSSISLYFRVLQKVEGSSSPKVNEHLINLIDSPGHIDFSSEVSVASRLCDGAVVLVDVVEGVCSQTIGVLRQCWIDNLKPILVLNKIDRLITELRLSPEETYIHLSKIIETVNAVLGSFFAGQRMQDDLLWREKLEKNLSTKEDESQKFVENDDKDLYFDPIKNNVVFASSIDSWGFTISQFALFYESKLHMNRSTLQKVLWGDYYFSPKSKKILTSKGLKGKNLKPLFVSFVLDNIYKVYQNTIVEKNMAQLEKIISVLNLKISPRDLKSKDTKNLLKIIMAQWLPLSSSVLLTVIQKLPSPIDSQKERVAFLIEDSPSAQLIDEKLKAGILNCASDSPVSCYVSKMLSIPEEELAQKYTPNMDDIIERGRKARSEAKKAADALEATSALFLHGDDLDSSNLTSKQTSDFEFEFEFEEDEDEETQKPVVLPTEHLIGFARVFSGKLKVGDSLLALGPKYDPSVPAEHVAKITISSLYLIMGREFASVQEIPPGNICGIGGLEGKVLKNGTLISPNITGINMASIFKSSPIVKVSIEPVDPTQMKYLENGLKLLNEADPCVETYVEDNGELILATAGELHLERCLKDLKERFAGIEIQVSKPLIPYRETIVFANDMSPPINETLGRGFSKLVVGDIKLVFKVQPLYKEVTKILIENQALIEQFTNPKNIRAKALSKRVSDFQKMLQEVFEENHYTKDEEVLNVENIVSFGPKRVGPNICFDFTKGNNFKRLFLESNNNNKNIFEHEDSIVSAFQLGTLLGPLADEPVQGIAVIVFSLETLSDSNDISGKLIRGTRESIKNGFLDWSPRIMLAMYQSTIQTSPEAIGKVYSVIQRCRGHIISEEMKEGTPFFTINSRIPVIEAFGFSDEIRKKTSGAANPQLVFAGFESIDENPFWIPNTEEELEELGEFAERENVARKYVNDIRRSKGLFVDEKVIKNSEKQRTLKRD